MNGLSEICVLLAQCVYVFLRWSYILIVSPRNINRLDFVIETQCVYCEVGITNPTTRRNNPEDLNLQENGCDNLNPHIMLYTSI